MLKSISHIRKLRVDNPFLVSLYFPTKNSSFYEDSHIILHVESTACFRDLSREIAVKNPLLRGDFSFGEAVKPYTKNFFVISLTSSLYHIFPEIKFFSFRKYRARSLPSSTKSTNPYQSLSIPINPYQSLSIPINILPPIANYSTVTLFARFCGLSTSRPSFFAIPTATR